MQTFLECENLTRSLTLGVDFAKQHAAGVQEYIGLSTIPLYSPLTEKQ